MAKQKLERNKLFLQDWQKGFSNVDLAEKYHMSKGGVKALKQRLRVRNPNLYTEKRPGLSKVEGKTISPQVDKLINQQITKRMTIYLKEELINDIKHLAIDRGSNISELVGKIIKQYLESIK